MWRIRTRAGTKIQRQFFASEAVAKIAAGRVNGERLSAKAVWALLPLREREELILAFYRMREQGLELRAALDGARDHPRSESPKLGVVIAEMVQVKRNAGRSGVYVDSLEAILNQFAAGRTSLAVGSVSLGDVERFLDSKKLASRSTHRARLSTLFKFAIRRGYRPDNPCARLEAVTYLKPAPRVFSVEEFGRAVIWLDKNRPQGLGWFALSCVCGLRPMEAEKTVPERDINFAEGFVKVEAQTTKVRQRRVVYPKREAMEFLRWAISRGEKGKGKRQRAKGKGQKAKGKRQNAKGKGQKAKGKGQTAKGKGQKAEALPMKPKTRKRILKQLRAHLGWPVWPKDITRHTAASYWLASDGSAAHVAEMLGNSERVLKRDYKALVTREEAVAFWKRVKGELTNLGK